MRFRHVIALFAVLALAFTACGDDGDTESSDSADRSSESDTNNDSDSGSDTTATVNPGDLDVSEEAFDAVVPEQCEFLFNLSVSLGLAVAGQADASDFDVAQAPDEVKDDVQALADAFDSFDPTNPASAQNFSTEEVEAATQNIQDFVDANCDPAELGQG